VLDEQHQVKDRAFFFSIEKRKQAPSSEGASLEQMFTFVHLADASIGITLGKREKRYGFSLIDFT
jgi:hypothetical protein